MEGNLPNDGLSLEVEYVPTSSLVAYENNAKLHPDWQVDQIVASIEEFGFADPIAIWHDGDGRAIVVEGHGRLLAARRMGLAEVPTICLDAMTDEERRAYGLAHNKLTMNTDFDFEALAKEVSDLSADFDMSDFGFSQKELAMATGKTAGDVVEDEAPEPPSVPKHKRGDMVRLGRHVLLCGDSTVAEDVKRLVGDEDVDLFLTDPPYNVNYEGATKDHLRIENDHMSNEQFIEFLRDAFANADSVMKPGASFYIYHSDSGGYSFRYACSLVGWTIRQCLIWNKNAMVLGRQDYQWKHEPILYGWKDGAPHSWYSDRKQTTVIDFDKPLRADIHPTMKPVGLVAMHIANSSKEGDVVLDLFGGSGSVLMACEQLGRKCLMMEFDPRYFDAIITRWENATGMKAEEV